MANRETTFIEITPEVLLKAYACGIFPMAESAEDPALYWIEPESGASSRSTAFTFRRGSPAPCARPYTVSVDHDFDAVIDGCAEPQGTAHAPGSTDASAHSIASSTSIGHCHSVEVYDGDLVGGLYGVSLGACFSAKACFIAPATRRRSRWCIWLRGCAPADSTARHAICHRSSDDIRRGRSLAAAISQAARSSTRRRRRLRRHQPAHERRAGAAACARAGRQVLIKALGPLPRVEQLATPR